MHSLDGIKKQSFKIERTTIFIKLFEYIFNAYTAFQERNNCIDFDDMIIKALNAIEDNKYKHNYSPRHAVYFFKFFNYFYITSRKSINGLPIIPYNG
jgi:ATP-dependent exoDNAse (exonuclease V) beta subunit